MLENAIIFYNGFNLLVDIIVGLCAGLWFYRIGKRSGFLEGYGAGASDYAGKDLPARGWSRGD